MKVMLLKDVYKLGRAGDIKKVANGYGRNYLIPMGLATLATKGALKQAERIRTNASEQRAILNKEMGVVAEKLNGIKLTFASRAGETGKLYGSVTNQMIADALNEMLGIEISKREIDAEPIRNLGEHKVTVRLTMDLTPEVDILVHREGEAIEEKTEEAETEEAEEAVEEVEETAEETAE
jgi:large subunit ribosomal protein L9